MPTQSELSPSGVLMPSGHACRSQCDGCHTRWHCVEASTGRGDLIMCRDCAARVDAGDGIPDIHADWPAVRNAD